MKTQTILGRRPSVPNKYGLLFSDLKYMYLKDRTKVTKPRFWRNDIINAWCISAASGDDIFGDEFWLGIYDKPYRNRLVRAYFTSYGGMCGYQFTKFYDPSEIENKYDLQIQEKALAILNALLDDQIIEIKRQSGKVITGSKGGSQ